MGTRSGTGGEPAGDGRRRAPGKRWSARSSLERWDADSNQLHDGLGTAAKVKVHYRLDGASRSATFERASL